MSGGQGLPVTFPGTATTTEAYVAITSGYKRGYPNKDGSVPTPQALSTFLRGDIRIVNHDATNNLLVRINGAANRATAKPGETIQIRGAIVFSLTVQSSAATVQYDVIGLSS